MLEGRIRVASWTRRQRALDAERSGHAEMHDQRVAGRQDREEIFAAPRQGLNGVTAQAPRESGGEWFTEIGAIEHDAREARAGHRRFEAPADALDFRQLRHLILGPLVLLRPADELRGTLT